MNDSPPTTADALVLGDANLDLSWALPNWPRPGDDCQASSVTWDAGGGGLNAAVVLARLGFRVRLLARLPAHMLKFRHLLYVSSHALCRAGQRQTALASLRQARELKVFSALDMGLPMARCGLEALADSLDGLSLLTMNEAEARALLGAGLEFGTRPQGRDRLAPGHPTRSLDDRPHRRAKLPAADRRDPALTTRCFMRAPAWKERSDALRIGNLSELFHTPKPIIGMVHLWPLPGAPGYEGGGLQPIIDAALTDAQALAEGGCDGLIVENMWDIPFRAGSQLPPESIAAHAVAARAVAQTCELPLGINLVHNGGLALLAVALAAGADFIRVCMFTGAGVWDGGDIDQGCAAELMRRRHDLRAEHIKILADVDKKHSVRFPGIDLATHMEWTRFFGADGLIVSGRMTGDSPGMEKLREARRLCPDRPLLVGSGADVDNIAELMSIADGIIVGSSIKVDGQIHMPVDIERVRRLIDAARA